MGETIEEAELDHLALCRRQPREQLCELLCFGKIFGNYNAGNELECRMNTFETCSKSSTTEISGYKYDGAGNETAITGYNDPASTSFAFNNLSQLEGLTPPGKADEKLKYLGSGQSKLTGLGTTTIQNSTLGITKQTIEGNASYYARTPDGTLIDERLPGGTSYNPVYDAQGDVIGLLDSNGALAQTVRYGPYGENTNTSGTVAYSTTNDPFLFQGGYHTPGGNIGVGNVPNGLYHYGQRYYDPTTGRWMQPDPASGMTNFTFAGDDPINQIDPTGEMGMAGMETTAAQDEVKWCTAHPWNFYHEQAVYVRREQAAQKANPGPDEFGEFAIKCAWGSGGYLGVAKVVDVVKVSVAGALATCVLGVLAP